ncbi:hypothetical protein E3J62_00130 [candidate division TA06 bacterium]|uniref:WD40 repeat domain-containing protein n=1 Tax=candidate division TA06 bacterium TaxID=2250710 RepID=A0A523UZG6_UNCT6|nr:MAG: hypothetical protein E3J62_00130 [candidate division TA06 bacterium]
MKKAGLVLRITTEAVLVCLLLAQAVIATEQKGHKKKKVTLELVSEQWFQEEIINVAFGQERSIVVTENKIYSLENSTGELAHLRSTYQGDREPTWRRTWVYPSTSGKYLGFYHNVLLDSKKTRPEVEKKRLAVFELIDSSGRLLWRREKEISPGTEFYAPNLSVSNRGYVVETDLDLHSKLVFCDSLGHPIRHVRISEAQFENGVTHGETWSWDGEFFAIFSDEGLKNDEDYISHLTLYTKDGNEIWQHQQKGFLSAYHSSISISPDNKSIVAFTRDNFMEIFDLRGSRMSRHHITRSGDNRVLFRENEKELVIYSDIGVISSFAGRDQTGPSWKRTYANSEITSLQQIGGEEIAVAGIRDLSQESSVVSFLDTGNQETISTLDFAETGRSTDSLNKVGCPLVKVQVGEGISLTVVFPRRFLCYRVTLPEER